ncbi:MAG: hypothetical protein WCF33_10475 [Pseudonocardiaceae bacterium]
MIEQSLVGTAREAARWETAAREAGLARRRSVECLIGAETGELAFIWTF